MSALIIRHGKPQALPIDVLLSAIPSLPRHALDRLVERAIDHMDASDGDPDLELNGDELDSSLNEEDFHSLHVADDYPGCPISDPGEDNYDMEDDRLD